MFGDGGWSLLEISYLRGSSSIQCFQTYLRLSLRHGVQAWANQRRAARRPVRMPPKLPPNADQRTSCRHVARTFCNYYLLFNFHVQYDVDYNVHQSFHVCYSRGLEFIMSMTI